MEKIKDRIGENPVVEKLARAEETAWINPKKECWDDAGETFDVRPEEIEGARARLERFAPLILRYFPETKDRGGLIESPLEEIPKMKAALEEKTGSAVAGRLLLKEDSHLAIAGSVKARGGIYEVLKYAEDLAVKHGMLKDGDSYAVLGEEENRAVFRKYTIQVGSTGNLGLSIGIISAVLGFRVIVHMSADAKEWKKQLLRKFGVEVREYEQDYGEAVRQGRALSDQDPNSYFVDDENSRTLFIGYATAGKRLKEQLDEQKIVVDKEHPLFVYIPCGVGGAPGGITAGLKWVFGDAVHCFFAEPVQAPCMLLGMASGLHNEIAVQDIGLTGKTDADGLAVGRPSAFAGKMMERVLSGEVTVEDRKLLQYMKLLMDTEEIFLEPSACAGFAGVSAMAAQEEFQKYVKEHGLEPVMGNAVQIVWATGGSLVPEEMRRQYLEEARILSLNVPGFAESGNWYKGNLHSHTVNSDGHLTPAESVKLFREHGYHFLCFSEHDRYTDYRDEFDCEDFIILPGLEASAVLYESEGSKLRPKVHHIHGILGTKEMQKQATKEPYKHMEIHPVDKYYGDWDGAKAAQKLADEMTSRGMIATYNHPIWSRVREEEFIHTKGIWAMEIYNYGTVNESATGYDETYWDVMLREGKQIFAFASDDNHNDGIVEDACGGYIVVKAEELSREAIVKNMLAGNYYSSSGPEIYDWGIQDGKAYVSSSPVYRIDFIAGNCINDGTSIVCRSVDETVESGEYVLKGHEKYVRVKCTDRYGKTAWSNPIFLDRENA